MDSGNDMHQQFLKDFIQSLQANSDKIQSQSHSESSLNPNAAEFVPSYLIKNSSIDENERMPSDEERPTSSTTLVQDPEIVGDALTKNQIAAQNRIQRQLFNLMTQLGKQYLPLAKIQFTLAPNGQGILVQFMAPEISPCRQTLDANLCQAAALHLEIGDCADVSRPANVLANQFLSRMCEVLTQPKEITICPRCTALPKKQTYTEQEIERQIEDIKAFEQLINDDAGTRYQDAFKELCHKLGLTGSDNRILEKDITLVDVSSLPTLNDINEVNQPAVLNSDDNGSFFNDDDDQTPQYEWDSFTPEFTTTKVYRYAKPSGSEVHVNELNEYHQTQEPEQQQIKNEFELNVPNTTPAMSTTTSNLSNTFPKLYKLGQSNCSTVLSSSRKTFACKEKDSKMQRLRYSSPVKGPGIGSSLGTTLKKLTPPIYGSGNRSKSHQRELKSNVIRNMAELPPSQIAKPTVNSKLETRTHTLIPKPQQDQIYMSKTKSGSLGRAGGIAAAQVVHQMTKQNSGLAPQKMAPRQTHASQMRQSEVKRRLSLMRAEDTDVQYNEYLFK